MIGFQADHQERLFYFFKLEDHVPQNHLLRGIGRHLDLSDLRQHLSAILQFHWFAVFQSFVLNDLLELFMANR